MGRSSAPKLCMQIDGAGPNRTMISSAQLRRSETAEADQVHSVKPTTSFPYKSNVIKFSAIHSVQLINRDELVNAGVYCFAPAFRIEWDHLQKYDSRHLWLN